MIPRLRNFVRPCLLILAAGGICSASLEATAQSSRSAPAEGWHLVTIPDAWRKMPSGNLKPIERRAIASARRASAATRPRVARPTDRAGTVRSRPRGLRREGGVSGEEETREEEEAQQQQQEEEQQQA